MFKARYVFSLPSSSPLLSFSAYLLPSPSSLPLFSLSAANVVLAFQPNLQRSWPTDTCQCAQSPANTRKRAHNESASPSLSGALAQTTADVSAIIVFQLLSDWIASCLDTTSICLRTIRVSRPSDSLCCDFASDPYLIVPQYTHIALFISWFLPE